MTDLNKPLWQSWTVWGGVLAGLGQIAGGIPAFKATGDVTLLMTGFGTILGAIGVRRAITASGPATPAAGAKP